MVQAFNVSRGATAARSPWRRLWQRACIGAVLCAAAGGAWAQSSDLVLAQHVVSPDPVPAGGIATITMTVQNNGTGAASNVKLADTIPAGSTFIGMTANSGGTCAAAVTPGDYECSWASIPYPGSRIVTLQVQLPTSGVWPNAATVTSSTTDPNPGNNALNRNITVVAAADLRVAAASSVGVGTVAAGTPYTYTVDVSNQGPDGLPAGQAPTVTFNVPAGSSITSRPTGTGWTCTPATGYPLTAPSGVTPGALITCTRSGTDSLANGASFPPITVPAVANVTGTVTAGFDVQSNFPDGNTTNNATTVDVALSAGTDMSITKTAAMAAVGGVTRATFNLQARQNGGSTPSNVTVTDTLPIGLDYFDFTAASPWNCNFNAGTRTLSCTYPGNYTDGPYTDLPLIQLRADVSGVGNIPNTGTVSADQADPVGSNDTSTVNVNNSADLGITKSASVSPVVVGAAYNWEVVVRNHGPMPVLIGQTITVTETIPVGMQVNSAISNANWTCSGTYASGPNSGNAVTYPTSGDSVTLVCTHTRSGSNNSNLAKDANAPTLMIPVTNTAAGNLSNTACLALSGAGPVEAGDTGAGFERNCHTTGITGTTGVNSADLQITKSASPNPVVVGDQLTYTLTARNNSGSVSATNVHVYDTLNNLRSSGAAHGFMSATTAQGTCSRNGGASVATLPSADVTSAVIDCDLGTLTPGQEVIITITVRPHNNTAATLSRPNTADINSLDIGDPNRGNNTITINSDVLPRVDATVTKTVNPSSNVRVGQPMVYTITASNGGPSTANKLIINDPLPPNTAFVSRGNPSNGGTCTQTPAVNDTTGTLICEWANVPSGGNRTVTMTVRALAAALNTTVSNTVNVSVDPLDTETNTANNSSTIGATIIDSLVDILVQKTDGPDPVPLGGLTTYTVAVRNTGPSIGTNLVVTDTFPNAGNTARFSYQGNLTATVAGVAVPSPACTQPAIGAMTGTLECTFPAIAIGVSNEVVLTYQMRAESIITAGDYSGTQGNRVVVRVDENETQTANNQVDEDTTTSRVAPATPIDLGIVKTTTPGRALPGTEYDYTLTVTNHEASGSGLDVLPAYGAQVTDTLPAGLTFVSAPSCSYSSGTRQVVCVVSNLAAAANVVFTVRVRLDSPYTGPASLSNTAAVDIPGDPVPGNNTSTVPKQVGNPPSPPAAIPTLSEWGLILLSLMLGAFAVRRMPVRGRR